MQGDEHRFETVENYDDNLIYNKSRSIPNYVIHIKRFGMHYL